MKVLLVDDEQELVATLTERLAFRGIQANWATTGEQALKYLENETFDLAVLDVKMPKMGGIELKKRLEEKCPGMKFIFVTGHGSEDEFKACTSEVGSDCFLVKPISIQVLVEKMREVLAPKGVSE
ncbi:MAG: response regulator [Desulfobacterales bacterium]|nr:MAG: response regulator [Desulfobacterales bacterium]